MTKFFTLLANIFFPLRSVLVFTCFISLFSIFYLLIFSTVKIQEQYLTTCLLLFLWGLVLFVLCHSFYDDSHSDKASQLKNDDQLGWFSRLKQKLAKVFLWIYSLIFVVLIIVSIHFSLKILTL